MSNEYYTHTGWPATSGSGQSVDARSELNVLQAAFDKLPPLASNAGKLVVVNGSGNGLSVMGAGQANSPLTNWTPTFTASVPGDLAITYQVRTGAQYRLGGLVLTTFDMETSAFTWTTASGSVQITGMPSISVFVSNCFSTLSFKGITKAGYTQFSVYAISNASNWFIYGSGSGMAHSQLTIADFPSGGQVFLKGVLVQGG